ncbi:hypothetical protein ACRAWD_20410 [Caulobacter segnis]
MLISAQHAPAAGREGQGRRPAGRTARLPARRPSGRGLRIPTIAATPTISSPN